MPNTPSILNWAPEDTRPVSGETVPEHAANALQVLAELEAELAASGQATEGRRVLLASVRRRLRWIMEAGQAAVPRSHAKVRRGPSGAGASDQSPTVACPVCGEPLTPRFDSPPLADGWCGNCQSWQ